LDAQLDAELDDVQVNGALLENKIVDAFTPPD
jgi:hypothetical protein